MLCMASGRILLVTRTAADGKGRLYHSINDGTSFTLIGSIDTRPNPQLTSFNYGALAEVAPEVAVLLYAWERNDNTGGTIVRRFVMCRAGLSPTGRLVGSGLTVSGRIRQEKVGEGSSGSGAVVATFEAIGALGSPAFQNSWVAHGSGYSTPGYVKDGFNQIKLKGTVKTGTIGSSIFTLPVGSRPAETMTYLCSSGVASPDACSVEVRNNGLVVPINGDNARISLDSIPPFMAEQ